MKIEPLAEQPIEVDFQTVDGVFIKHVVIKKRGTALPQHAHVWDHETLIASGSLMVWVDGVFEGVRLAPCALLIKAGVKHTFVAAQDNTVLACIHNITHSGKVDILAEHQLAADELEGLD